MAKDMLSASIVVYGGAEQAKITAASVLENTKKYPLTLYVIDNASPDDAVQKLREISDISLIELKENVGFGGGHNAVINKISSKYHAVINPDVELNCDVLAHLVEVLEQNDDIMLIAPKIIGENGEEQHLPKRHPTFRYLFLGRLSRFGGIFEKIRKEYTRENEGLENLTDIEFCSGCFFLIRSEIFKKLGGFDKRYFMYMEDADLSREVSKYGRVVFDPTVSVKHLWKRESAKSLKFLFIHLSSAFKYLKKWRKKV
ncbi:MAG: glycosyltransferase family 2 protein [Clostridia bacterium]|nr:glycosyltransferase family 2 protein [Clostridia bacterium]